MKTKFFEIGMDGKITEVEDFEKLEYPFAVTEITFFGKDVQKIHFAPLSTIVKSIHQEIVQLEASEEYNDGNIPISDLFENNHIEHFIESN